ncbi:serine hydrolase FSH [Cadophora sp. MPI-SDFR-AT-0126]|nr:serine hydrolase FSH [Leotiomycetes sp. MPI-SDFR-AT-0126]
MRFLCLHGQGTNSDIMKLQTRALRNLLPVSYEYDFIDGEEHSESPEELAQIYPGPYLQYASCAETVPRSVEYLEEIMAEDGPFDGVIGFSQGAVCAARMILRSVERDPYGPQPFKAAIFLCAASLFYHKTADEYNEMMKAVTDITIPIPTVHVIGQTDLHRPFSCDLVKLCDKKLSTVVDAQIGHVIPQDVVSTTKIQKAIELAVQQSGMGF